MRSSSLRILWPTDVFPPHCGGAGWSAHALALSLAERGHHITAIVPQRAKRGTTHELVLGVPTIQWGYWAPRLPIIQNYFRHELLWPHLATVLIQEGRSVSRRPLLIHAQHVQTTPPAIVAGRRLGAPVIVTVRDHWPWDYFATGLHGDRLPYARQTWASLATDLVARLGPLQGALALPAIPAILAHLRRRQQALAQATAVIAVSKYIAERLRGLVDPERLHIIPNMVDLGVVEMTIATPPFSITPGEPYLLFVGKLEYNKGAHLLIEIMRQSLNHLSSTGEEGFNRLPRLVIAGDGPMRPMIERELDALGVSTRFLAWIDHDEVLRLMAHCTLLLFPSVWGDALSRVLLEACACGAPVLAMPTGGTRDVIVDGVSGVLEPTVEGVARRLVVLLQNPIQRQALGAGARQRAHDRFARPVVVEQIEQLYLSLLRDQVV